jgi:hypothetical protein
MSAKQLIKRRNLLIEKIEDIKLEIKKLNTEIRKETKPWKKILSDDSIFYDIIEDIIVDIDEQVDDEMLFINTTVNIKLVNNFEILCEHHYSDGRSYTYIHNKKSYGSKSKKEFYEKLLSSCNMPVDEYSSFGLKDELNDLVDYIINKKICDRW